MHYNQYKKAQEENEEVAMTHSTVYVAGPLFSVAERSFNASLVNALREQMPDLTFVLPQDYAKEISGQGHFLEKVFTHCLKSIDEADAVLCILDGPDVDSGTSVEMGYAYAHRKPMVGIRSDLRSSEDNGVNLMVSHICTEMLWLPSNRLGMTEIIAEIVAALNHVLG